MKRLITTGMLFLTCLAVRAVGCETGELQFSEITYVQDSANPLTIHVTFKTIAPMHCAFSQDVARMYWGDTIMDIPLADTIVQDNPIYPIKIYYGSHTYPSVPHDSIITFGVETYPMSGRITNTENPVQFNSLATLASIKFSTLAGYTGISSPSFSSPYFAFDTLYKPLTFDPEIHFDSSLTVTVALIHPYADVGITSGAVIFPNEWPVSPLNTLSWDTATGILIWDSPQYWGGFLITYEVAFFKNGLFAGTISRNMIIDVKDVAAGIAELDETNIVIMPNPVADKLTLRFSENKDVKNTFQVVTTEGRLIMQGAITQSNAEIDMHTAPAGIYFLQLQNEKQRRVKKFVKE